MRRFAALLAVLSLLSFGASSVSASSSPGCRVWVTPAQGTTTTTYRINGAHFPSAVDGGSLEVQIVVWHRTRHDARHAVRIMWLSLIPGGHRFYVDINDPTDGQPGLRPDRYHLDVETPHQAGCHTHAAFRVTS